ncbi:MAG: hypothetical protein U5R31_05930 [Acidimicrobiia bacterium]|nr:hypothetical protein [Acidimicrobiia bacterium]
MSAYNSVNGEWCGENATLLRSVLRGEWGWDGFVTSDFTFGLRDPVKSVEGRARTSRCPSASCSESLPRRHRGWTARRVGGRRAGGRDGRDVPSLR